MVKLEDAAILEQSANDEYHHPLPQKHTEDGRMIYLSRNNFGILLKPMGVIQITDFDLSVRGDVPQSSAIQAEVLRAPEVILDAGYTYAADIWSLGVMVQGCSRWIETLLTGFIRSYGTCSRAETSLARRIERVLIGTTTLCTWPISLRSVALLRKNS